MSGNILDFGATIGKSRKKWSSQLRWWGLVYTSLVLALTQAIVFLAIPQFNVGVWGQAEGVISALHVLGGLAAIGLVPLFLLDIKSRRLAVHPLVLMCLALSAWSVVSGWAHTAPRLSWFGSPQLGEGAFWYLEFAAFSIIAMRVTLHRGPRIWLGFAVGVVATLTIFLQWSHAHGWQDWFFQGVLPHFPQLKPLYPVPYYFSDYVAFYAFLAPVALLLLWRRGSWPALGAACLLGAAGVFASEARASILVGFGIVPVLWAVLRWWPKFAQRRDAQVGVVLAIAIGATLAVNVVPPVVEAIGRERLGIRENGLAFRLINTAASRHHLAEIAIEAAASRPLAVLVGNGWGSYTHLLTLNLPVEWANLRDDRAPDKASASWDAVTRVDFHSHNFLVEAFLSVGLPGLILVAAIWLTPIVFARPRDLAVTTLCVAAIGGISVLWFQLAASMPLMALTWGLMCGPSRWPGWRLPAWIPTLVAAGSAIVLTYYGGTALRFAEMAYTFQPALSQPLFKDGRRAPCPSAFIDQGRGGEHLGFRLRIIGKYVTEKIAGQNPLKDFEIGGLRGLFCAVEDYIDSGHALFQLKVAALLTRADLAFLPDSPQFDPNRDEIFTNWERRLVEAISEAPKRTDLAVSYMLWLLKQERTADFERMAAWLYARGPNDAVSLWFSGLALLNHDGTAIEGIRRMKRSLNLGIERIMPIDDEIKAQLRGG